MTKDETRAPSRANATMPAAGAGAEPDATGRNIVLEVNAGAGGEDAAELAAQLVRMYLRYAARANLEHRIAAREHSPTGGTRHATLILGQGPTTRWSEEEGVHRVTRLSRHGSGRGRRQTSFASVRILDPGTEDGPPALERASVRIEVKRGHGPGGQHRNTRESAVRAVHVPSGLSADAQGERSQHANRREALRILSARVAHAQNERRRDAEAAQRATQAPSAFAHQVRSYRLERDQIDDHRTGQRIGGAKNILDGALDRLWQHTSQRSNP